MSRYQVIGDHGTESETLLHECDCRIEAKKWVNRYTQRGDFGGYFCIGVYELLCRDSDNSLCHYYRSVEDML